MKTNQIKSKKSFIKYIVSEVMRDVQDHYGKVEDWELRADDVNRHNGTIKQQFHIDITGIDGVTGGAYIDIETDVDIINRDRKEITISVGFYGVSIYSDNHIASTLRAAVANKDKKIDVLKSILFEKIRHQMTTRDFN